MTGTVCQRELRSLGRHWGSYWLRVLAGLAAMTVLGGGLLLARFSPLTGAQAAALVFAGLHGVLVVLLALVTPLLPADTLARERREGTLGLLFLTPLRPVDVVAGKCIAQAVRAVMIWVSALPVMAVPLLMGGIAPANLLWAAILQLGVLLCGLGAGLFATSRSRAWGAAMTRAALFLAVAAMLGAVTVAVTVAVRLAALAPAGTELPGGFERISFPPAVLFALPLHGAAHRGLLGWIGVGVPAWVVSAGRAGGLAFLAFSAVWFGLAVAWVLAALRGEVRREDSSAVTRPEPAAGASPWRRARGRGRPSPDNPIVWLQRTAPGAWWAPWGWLAVVLAVWVPLTVVLLRWSPDLRYLGWWIAPAMLAALGLAAAGSYRREIEEGTLELLLVTTLPTSRLVTGRLRALAIAFLPGLAAAWGIAGWFNDQEDWWVWFPAVALTGTSLVSLPLVGLRCALRRVHPLNGWIITALWGIVFPLAVGGVLTVVLFYRETIRDGWRLFWGYSVLTALAQLASAGWWGRLCAKELEDRGFLKRPLAR